MAERTAGVELLQQINAGRIRPTPKKHIERARAEIVAAIEELLEVGARIRPLYLGETQVGWGRGVHNAERKALARWIPGSTDAIAHYLRLGTSLPDAVLDELSAIEVRSLTRVIREMLESDLQLYPYLAAFATTATSEQLWCGTGTRMRQSRVSFRRSDTLRERSRTLN
jgi:hypothetical protein